MTLYFHKCCTRTKMNNKKAISEQLEKFNNSWFWKFCHYLVEDENVVIKFKQKKPQWL